MVCSGQGREKRVLEGEAHARIRATLIDPAHTRNRGKLYTTPAGLAEVSEVYKKTK